MNGLNESVQHERSFTADDPDILTGTLYQVAAARLAREQGPLTLQATTLVHETWIRMGGENQPSWASPSLMSPPS